MSSALLFLSILPATHHTDDNAFIEQTSADRVLISEFYPCALCSDEYVELVNAGSMPVNLRNWTLTDGEGTLTFNRDFHIKPGFSVSMSMNSTSFAETFGRDPDVSILGDSVLEPRGSFRMADSGDALLLNGPEGGVRDAVVYGNAEMPLSGWIGAPVPKIRQGEVAKRIVTSSGTMDTDSSADWFPFREYRYGFTEFQPLVVDLPGDSVRAFVSPDCSLECVLSALESARNSVMICTYEIGSVPVCHALLRATSRGVNVTVLVDGAPAGGLAEDELECLSALCSGGVRVLEINGNLSERRVQHIGALHAKYIVVDDAVSVVMSENFVPSGLPQDSIYGNRGWGVLVADARLASYLAQLFRSDSRTERQDVTDWRADPRNDGRAGLPSETNLTCGQSVLVPFTTRGGVRVHAIVSPDASVSAPYLSPMIEGSREILISQFQADLFWESRWSGSSSINPLAESTAAAMRNRASVRGLFDSSWYNAEGNKRIVSFLSGLAQNESLDGAFAQLDTRSPISILHNKGVIFDAERTLVSSNNWCLPSFAKNRELALLIESGEVAGYFRKAFDMDWTPDESPPNADAGLDRSAILGSTVVLDAGGSSDDRAIARWSWDIGSDGSIDSTEPVLEFKPDRSGTYRIVLTVVDAWDNEAKDTVFVEVMSNENPANNWLPERAPWWITPAAGALGALLGALFARHRRRSHNVNHGDADSHG